MLLEIEEKYYEWNFEVLIFYLDIALYYDYIYMCVCERETWGCTE